MKYMNRIIKNICVVMAASASVFFAASCSDWTETESVELDPQYDWDRNPELWAKYYAGLQAYRETEHFLVYARFGNSPEKATSEKSSLRSLPDSIDIVSLTNGDGFSSADAEDMEMMNNKGIRVLYQVDYASRSGEFASSADLTAYLDKVTASVQSNGLSGYSFTSNDKEMSSFIVEKLSSAKSEGQILVYEGDPAFVPESARSGIDYFVLATEDIDNAFDVHIAALMATSSYGIPAGKVLLAATYGETISDIDNEEHESLGEMAEYVISYGPLAGLAVYGLDGDYYHTAGNYLSTRAAIQVLNPTR